VAIIAAFAAVFNLNFGGEVKEHSGFFESFFTLFPDLIGDVETVRSGNLFNETPISTVVVFCYGFCLAFFVTNILLSIVMTHYDKAREIADGRFLSEGLLSRLQAILTSPSLSKVLTPTAVNEILRVLGHKPTAMAPEVCGSPLNVDNLGDKQSEQLGDDTPISFTLEDRKRLLRLEKALESLLIQRNVTTGA